MDNREMIGAVCDNDVELVKLLIDDGAEVTSCLLHIAAQNGSLEMTTLLIELLDPEALNSYDEISNVPLTHAARNGHVGVLEILLKAGADVNVQDIQNIGNTPLRNVIRAARYEVVELLLNAGADPDKPGWMQLTAFDIAKERSRNDKSEEAKQILDLVRRYSRHS